MVGQRPDLMQQKTQTFKKALHEVKVKPMELSGKAVQSKYALSKYVKEEKADYNNNKPISTSRKSPTLSVPKKTKVVAQTKKGSSGELTIHETLVQNFFTFTNTHSIL